MFSYSVFSLKTNENGACLSYVREKPNTEDFSVLRQNAAHYGSLDILEAITYSRICLCSVLWFIFAQIM